jgi:2-hydroxychromene-2-carboxylate isomerase
MHTLDFYFDPISPYAYLAFHQLPKTLEGLSVVVRYKPVLFGAMLNANGQKGPAEIDGKREWTYRQVLWQAKKMGLPMTMPAAHPFNPLPLLRAMLAAANSDGAVNRYVAEQAFSHVWTLAQDPASEQFLMAFNAVVDTHLTRRGNDALASDAVKLCLRHNTEAALDAGVFGVPTVVVNGYVFWGLDGLDMLRDYLNDPAWFDNAQGEWQQAAHVPVGIKRQ